MPSKRKRALVFDPREAPCAGVAAALLAEGLEIREATDAVQAFALPDFEPDLVVLVLESAEFDDVQLCEAVRRRVGPQVLIAVATAGDDGTNVEVLANAGVDEFIESGLAPSLLRHRFRMLLRRRDESAQLRSRIKELETSSSMRSVHRRVPHSDAAAPAVVDAPSVDTAAEQSDFVERLSQAVADEAFDLVYQPKVSAHTGEPMGAEALLRWNDPTLGDVSPVEFVPELERLNLIPEVGAWIVGEVCRQRSAWQAAGLDPGKIALNVSPLQLREPGLAEQIVASADRHGVDSRDLQVEVTEGCLIENPEEVAVTLSTLRSHGVGICIDDFGTGFSSLQYLARLPLDYLKLDRAFVTPLETDAEARTLVVAIIAMAWNLGLRVIGEGVETQAQWDFLTDHGCDEIQGFYVSRPLRPDAFAAWLSRPSGT